MLKRISNNEFKIGDATKTLTLPTLFHTLGNAIWSELDSRKDIGALRRQLQRAYLDTTITLVVNPASGVPDDARMLAWDQLRQLKTRLQSAQQAHHDEYTRIHLDESLMRVKRALDAKLVIDANPQTGVGR